MGAGLARRAGQRKNPRGLAGGGGGGGGGRRLVVATHGPAVYDQNVHAAPCNG